MAARLIRQARGAVPLPGLPGAVRLRAAEAVAAPVADFRVAIPCAWIVQKKLAVQRSKVETFAFVVAALVGACHG